MVPENNSVSLEYIKAYARQVAPALRYDGRVPATMWQEQAYARLWALLGLDYMIPCENDAFTVTEEFDLPDGHAMAFTFESEPGYVVPGYFLLPHGWQGETLPACLCLQGHSTGMHNSLAMLPDRSPNPQEGDRDFLVRAVKEGYVGVCIEQRYMGTRGIWDGAPGCSANRQASASLLFGRTAIGERVWDVMRLIDALKRHVPFADTAELVCLGNSGGGTATFYAACIEKRIKHAIPSCAFCTYKDSIVDLRHCECNYVPGIAREFDMGDLAGLIAPRDLIIVNGKEDTIFPDHGVREAYAVAERMYKELGGKLALVTGDGGHRFYADPAWETLHRFLEN